MSASTNISPTDVRNQQQDRRLTTNAGDIIGLNDSPVNVGGGSTLNITSANAQVASKALDTAGALASGSNAIAAQVARSQEQFVGAASQAKTVLWIAGIAAGAFVIPKLFSKSA